MNREIDTPIGRLVVEADTVGVTAVRWSASPTPTSDSTSKPEVIRLLDLVERQLDEYFAGSRRSFELPLHQYGTPFQLRAWEVLRGIDYGTTITYGEQARRLGSPSSVRAVGGANGRNPIGIVVPCHRVVGSNGSLTGFAGGVDVKRWLLEHERAHT